MGSGEQGLLILRAGGNMQWVFSATFHPVVATLDTPDGPRRAVVLTGSSHLAAIHFSKLSEAAEADGSNIPPGFGTWIDRGMEEHEPDEVFVPLDVVGVQRVVQLPTPGATDFTGFDKTDFVMTKNLLFEHGELFALKVKHPPVGSIEAVRGARTVHPWPPREGTTAELTVQPTNVTFGTQAVGTDTLTTITLRNSGQQPLDVLTMQFVGGHPQDFHLLTSAPGPSTESADVRLEPGESRELGIRWQPTAAGRHRSTLLIRHIAPSSPRAVPLDATAVESRTTVDIQPNNFSFGLVAIGAEALLAITLTNTGAAPLVVNGLQFEGANPDDFAVVETGCLQGSIEPSASCEIAVAFRPTAEGLRSASLEISDNAFDSPHRLSFAGAGGPPTGRGPDPAPVS